MRLEKIVLEGFKSFADKTELIFNSPVTAIVGPNGCGKSNVVDAVKWVLGEQSVKSLRSGQMADVIFSGSSSRKPQGTAEVNLFMSNTNGAASGHLPIDTDQIQISRRIFKTGESEYRINNKLCRLKDIRELFMDTGVCVRAYSIIEQGQVEQLLTASKTDRRIIFEEAAGISKYKSHKKEAFRRLEQTEQNLLRLADIINEVQKQLRSVKLAAGKARNYLQYRQRLKELQVNYSLSEYHKINTKNQEKRTVLAQLEEQFAAVAAEIAKNDAQISELAEEKTATENQLNQTDNSLIAIQSKIDQLLQKIEFLKSRIAELQQREKNTTERIKKLSEQENIFRADLTHYKSQLQDGEKLLEEKKTSIEQLQNAITEINTRCTSLEADLEDEKSGIIDIVRRTAQLHNELQSIGAYRDNLSSQKDRLAGRAERTGTELEQLLTEKAQHLARANDIEKVLNDLQQSLESKRKKIDEINLQITNDSKRLTNSKEARSALASEEAILTDMEARHEGLNNAVKNILQDTMKFSYTEGVLADIIIADIEYANAVEAALEGKTDAVVVNNGSKLLADKKTIESLEGRVHFICTDKIELFVDNKDLSGFAGIKGRVAEFVKYQEKYASLVWNLLGKILIVDSIDTAAQLAGQLMGEYKFVTLKGEFLDSAIVKAGPLGKATGLISRKSRLRQLQETIANITSEITAIEDQTEKNSQTVEHLTKLRTELRTAIYEATTEKMQISSKLAVFEQDIKRLSEEQPLIKGEIDLLEQQIAQSVQNEYDSKQKLQELEAVSNQRTTRIKELEAKYTEQKTQQQMLGNQLTDTKVAFGQITEHQQAICQNLESLQNQLHANQAAVEAAQAEIKTCLEQCQRGQTDILACESAMSQLYAEKDSKQQSISLLREKVEEILEKQNQFEETLRAKAAEKQQIEQKINELKIELSQLEVKSQDLIERVKEELQLDLAESYKNFSDEHIDWDKIREEITELRDKIERLGNVNVDAIAEQESLEQRYEFLSKQVEDLNQSKTQLQELISRLNKISKEKFIQTFEQIRMNFQQIFRKLFGGGKADVMLEDSEDVLEAGIEIIARPPGKETRSISLLSGGEKSMTAIALLFAVFKTKPSPFCFLDEVDAALDETNNERFNLLIHEFKKDSQFVVVTHSKRTMSMADQLYGITMQTRGVSKKISVSFDDFEEETLAPEQEPAAVA